MKALLPDGRDVHLYGGGLLFAAGAWLVWEPVGLMSFGALLVYLGIKAGS